MKTLQETRLWISRNGDVALDMIRIYLGVALMLKAVFFMGTRNELVRLIDETGTMWFAPAIMAHYIIIAHLVGGFLLAIGLFTRFAAFIQIPILLGAVFWVHMPQMLSMGARADVEFSALLLFLLVVIFAFGAGRWSVDHYYQVKEEHPVPPVGAAA